MEKGIHESKWENNPFYKLLMAVCVCKRVCVYVCAHACVFVYTYVCVHVRMCLQIMNSPRGRVGSMSIICYFPSPQVAAMFPPTKFLDVAQPPHSAPDPSHLLQGPILHFKGLIIP